MKFIIFILILLFICILIGTYLALMVDMGLCISKGEYIRRMYFIPTIEFETFDDGRTFLCLTFLKWYIGFAWYKGNNKLFFYREEEFN